MRRIVVVLLILAACVGIGVIIWNVTGGAGSNPLVAGEHYNVYYLKSHVFRNDEGDTIVLQDNDRSYAVFASGFGSIDINFHCQETNVRTTRTLIVVESNTERNRWTARLAVIVNGYISDLWLSANRERIVISMDVTTQRLLEGYFIQYVTYRETVLELVRGGNA